MTDKRSSRGQRRDDDWAEMLDGIEATGPSLLAEGHPAGRMVQELEPLLASDLRLRPWAALVAAAALHDAIRGDARVNTLITQAEEQFGARGDDRGTGYAAFVRGSVALGFGRLDEAVSSWRRSRELLTDKAPMDEALVAMVGLAAYQDGNLRAAVALAEEAVALSRLRRNPRQESSALVYLAFFTLSLGQCARADALLRVAGEVVGRLLSPEDRADAPMLRAAIAVVAALRGETAAAERHFAEAVSEAKSLGLGWQEAIIRSLRAEFLIDRNPELSLSDAREALAALHDLGEQWWIVWAERALALAAVALGDGTAGVIGLRRLLDRAMAPQERARTLVGLGKAFLQSGEVEAARTVLKEADELHQALGAEYWRAEGLWLLARADPAFATVHINQARAMSDGDVAYDELVSRSTRLSIQLLGQPRVSVDNTYCRFATHNAEKALYLLVLAPSRSLHAEVLAERLWEECPPDKQAVRVRNLLWQMRQGLGSLHAWRVEYRRKVIRLDLTGADVDVLTWERAAEGALGSGCSGEPAIELASVASIAEALRKPLLPEWQYEDWVIDHQYRLRQIHDHLSVCE